MITRALKDDLYSELFILFSGQGSDGSVADGFGDSMDGAGIDNYLGDFIDCDGYPPVGGFPDARSEVPGVAFLFPALLLLWAQGVEGC